MFTIIGGDGREYGPVSIEKIREWLAGGRANLDTRARREGEADWKTLADFPEFTAAEPAPSATPLPAPVGPVDARAFANDLIARARPLDVFGCLGRSFDLWKSNFGPLVGVTLLVMLAQGASQMVPFVGFLSSLLLNGVFYGGLYYYYIGKARGQPRELGDAFAGFSKAFVPLMLASLITTGLVMLVVFLVMGTSLAPFFKAAMMHDQPPLPSAWMIVSAVICFAMMLYIGVSWAFGFILVIDRGLGPWTALEVSRRVIGHQWFRVFAVMLLGGLMTLLGVVALFVGIFLTLPLSIGAVVCAYEDLCNPRA